MLLKGTNLYLENELVMEMYEQCSDYSQQYYIISFKVAKRLDLKCSHHKKEMVIM